MGRRDSEGDLILRILRFSATTNKSNPIRPFQHLNNPNPTIIKFSFHAFTEGVYGIDSESIFEADGEVCRVLVEGGIQ